jgi:hypothetical protein
MANGQGTAILDYGASPGSNEAFIVVTGIPTISSTSKAEAYFMGDDTTIDHTAVDHRYTAALVGLTCGTPVTGVGFTIYGYTPQKLERTYQVRWVWTD